MTMVTLFRWFIILCYAVILIPMSAALMLHLYLNVYHGTALNPDPVPVTQSISAPVKTKTKTHTKTHTKTATKAHHVRHPKK
jgi:hypothetical protein